ncbi:MAG: TIR domain-containing protein, partial [Pseudonocardiaceae bacterium]
MGQGVWCTARVVVFRVFLLLVWLVGEVLVARVFISHASKDRALAGEVHRWLVEAGHEVFLDQDVRDGIALGALWRQRLWERLRWADAMVCVVSSAYLVSTWCAAEVAVAQSRGSRLLPLRVEPGLDHPLLSEVQYGEVARDLVGARAVVVEALRRIDAAGGAGWSDDRSPFPGLRPFDSDRHRVFFGRAQEVKHLAELLRSAAGGSALLVVGPSGCGKSSLVRAGLLPVMAGEPGWRVVAPMLPGVDPVGALVRVLAVAARRIGLDWTVEQVSHQLHQRGLSGVADEVLLAGPGGPHQRLLLVVDQVEELLTQSSQAERDRFVELLGPALGGPVHVVGTLRPEFLDPLLGHAGLASVSRSMYPVRPLLREALRAVIEKPAELAGITLDEGLAERLVADTDSGEALPRLAFTLAQLADGVGRGGQLSGTRYEQIGGVRGALTRQADAALAGATAATGRRREEVIAGLLRLVTVDDQGRPTRWRVPRDELPELVTRELDVFVGRRLVITDTDNGRVVVGVAHEAFLSAWTPLTQAIEENASALRAHRAVEQAATEWDNEGRPSARLWEHGQLAAADLFTDRAGVSSRAREFLSASIRRDRLRRRSAVTILSVLLILALAAAGFAFTQQRAATQQRDIAVSRQVAEEVLALHDTNPGLAAQLALAAYQLAPTMEARDSLFSLSAQRYATRLTGHTSAVYSVAFSSDRKTLATASGDTTVRLWGVSDPHHPSLLGALAGHTYSVRSVAFSPDGRILATASGDKTVRLWDVSDPRHAQPLGILTGHTDTVSSVAFSPDGRILATASGDKTVRLWDVSDPRQAYPLGTLTGHADGVRSVAFSPDGRILASASNDRT